jgi:hypothetical protein
MPAASLQGEIIARADYATVARIDRHILSANADKD